MKAHWIMATRISALSTEVWRDHQRTPRPIDISKKYQVNLRMRQKAMKTRSALCSQDGLYAGAKTVELRRPDWMKSYVCYSCEHEKYCCATMNSVMLYCRMMCAS